MNKRIYLKLRNGNYSANGSRAELQLSDMQYVIRVFNESASDKMLYFDEATGDVYLTDDVPTFMKGRLK